MDADLITEYDRRHEKLRTYLQTAATGNLRDIAVDIRPTLEYFCRVAYPADYPPGGLLGNFRDRCQTRLDQANPIMSAADVQELRDLTDYGNLFHHDSNPQGYLTVVVTDAAVAGLRSADSRLLQQTLDEVLITASRPYARTTKIPIRIRNEVTDQFE